ncbi:MAG: (Fe-S)-binding protein [Nanoarchaeota archaeon]|nr:(Fe-S)-binding protein [Nanoarchaeota archaeon]
MFKFLEKLTNRNVLYFPGCMTKYVLKDKEDNYKKILKKIGVDFIMLKDEEFCCGSPVLNAGYKEDFENLKEKNLEKFKKFGVGEIITNCPACYNMLKDNYNLKVKHISQVILENIEVFKKKFDEDITYHDSCHLGRQGKIFEEPRDALKAIGFEIKEFKNNREKASCCGAGGGMKNNLPKLANEVANNVLSKVKTEKMITACPMCYQHFKDNSKDVLILELGDVFV